MTKTRDKNEAIISVHPFRRLARRKERKIQKMLNDLSVARQVALSGYSADKAVADGIAAALVEMGVPEWARGTKVEHAGPFQFAVMATERRGH